MRIIHSGSNYGGAGKGTSIHAEPIRDRRPPEMRVLSARPKKVTAGTAQWKRSFAIPMPHFVYRGSVVDALGHMRNLSGYLYRVQATEFGEALLKRFPNTGREQSIEVLVLSEGVYSNDPHNPATGGIVLVQLPGGPEMIVPRKFFERMTRVPAKSSPKKKK